MIYCHWLNGYAWRLGSLIIVDILLTSDLICHVSQPSDAPLQHFLLPNLTFFHYTSFLCLFAPASKAKVLFMDGYSAAKTTDRKFVSNRIARKRKYSRTTVHHPLYSIEWSFPSFMHNSSVRLWAEAHWRKSNNIKSFTSAIAETPWSSSSGVPGIPPFMSLGTAETDFFSSWKRPLLQGLVALTAA